MLSVLVIPDVGHEISIISRLRTSTPVSARSHTESSWPDCLGEAGRPDSVAFHLTCLWLHVNITHQRNCLRQSQGFLLPLQHSPISVTFLLQLWKSCSSNVHWILSLSRGQNSWNLDYCGRFRICYFRIYHTTLYFCLEHLIALLSLLLIC